MAKSKHSKNDTAICLFAYNRYEHFKVTTERLFKEDLSSYSIFIFQDGPKNPTDEIAVRKVSQLIESLDHPSIVLKYISEKNRGLAASIFSGLNRVFETYEKAIILEDDILIRSGFLDFINAGLEEFASNPSVAGVAGFSYLDHEVSENYFLPIGTSWGWGTWKRVWKNVKNDPKYYVEEIGAQGRESEFDFGSYPFHKILRHCSERKNDSWAIQFYASFFLKEQRFLFPRKSLCENIGFDNSGTHTSESMKAFNSQNMESEVQLNMPDSLFNRILENKVRKRMKKLAGNDLLTRIKTRIRRLK